MAAQGTDLSGLATVRRFEAAGFRAWPAATVHYDGTWVIRLTAGHPAKRLNSVNPLDPGDTRDLEERIARAGSRFEAYGRELTFRISPLSGAALCDHLDEGGWSRFSESLVMAAPLEAMDMEGALDQIPLRDLGRFTAATLAIRGLEPRLRAGLSEIVGSIRPEAGLFVLEEAATPVATAICVRDGALAGLFEVATDVTERRRGHARRIVLSALKWAKLKGATTAWLQVEAENEGAVALYRSLGFEELYRYHFRRPPAPDGRR